MKKIVKGEIVKMTEVEILEDLDYEIKNFAGIDVQILHRFAFIPAIDDENLPYIEVFDRYKEETLLDKNFGDLAAALDYLRGRYKKEPGIEYEVIERKVAADETKPKSAGKKRTAKPTEKKAIEALKEISDIGEIVEMSSIKVKDREEFIKEFYKELWEPRDKGDEE